MKKKTNQITFYSIIIQSASLEVLVEIRTRSFPLAFFLPLVLYSFLRIAVGEPQRALEVSFHIQIECLVSRQNANGSRIQFHSGELFSVETRVLNLTVQFRTRFIKRKIIRACTAARGGRLRLTIAENRIRIGLQCIIALAV